LIISLGLAIESQSRHQAGRRRWIGIIQKFADLLA